MAYDNWITGIYSLDDAFFKYWEHEDEIKWLRKMIPREKLWDKDGISKFKPKNEYEGYKRENLTGKKHKHN